MTNYSFISFKSPYLLHISFMISFILFSFLSAFYLCNEGDKCNFCINKHFKELKLVLNLCLDYTIRVFSP